MADYSITFSGNQNPFVDSDWTDEKSSFQIASDELKAEEKGISAKMRLSGVTVDRSATSLYIEVTIGANPGVYNDVGGPGFAVDGGADDFKGYWLRHHGNNIYLFQMDLGTAGDLGSSIQNFGSASWATDDRLGFKIDGIGSSPVAECYRNDVQLGSSKSITSYVTEVEPYFVIDPQNVNARTWTKIEFTGTESGSFTLTGVDGNTDGTADGTIWNNTACDILGDFSGTTITSVKFKQTDMTDYTLNGALYSETDTAISLVAMDLHTTGLFDGDATIELSDGIDTFSLPFTAVYGSFYGTVIADSIDAVNGAFKDIASPSVGDYLHFEADIDGSEITARSDGPHIGISPALPNGSTGTLYHGDYVTRTWTIINATFHQNTSGGDGPTWEAMPTWSVQENVVSTFDLTPYVTAGNGTLDSWAINPAVAGFQIDQTGTVAYLGTQDAGLYTLTIEVADDDDTVAAALTINASADPLVISNPRVTSIATKTATITVDCEDLDDPVYFAVRVDKPYSVNDPEPIKRGTSAVWYQNRPGTTTLSAYATGLTQATLYHYGIVQSDGAQDSNVIVGSFTTAEDVTSTGLEGKAPSRPL